MELVNSETEEAAPDSENSYKKNESSPNHTLKSEWTLRGGEANPTVTFPSLCFIPQ